NSERSQGRVLYSLMLGKLYGFTLNPKPEIVPSLPGTATRLLKYYRVNIDSQFIDVEIRNPLPPINYSEIKNKADGFDWMDLQERLPLEHFTFKGFSILTIDDVTISQSLEDIKNLIIHGKEKESIYDQLILSLKRSEEHTSELQ